MYFTQWRNNSILKDIDLDLSKGDFAVTCRMIKDGYKKDVISLAISNSSPNIQDRKRNHIEDYCKRTVEAAIRIINK
jgi:hypothetical protein